MSTFDYLKSLGQSLYPISADELLVSTFAFEDDKLYMFHGKKWEKVDDALTTSILTGDYSDVFENVVVKIPKVRFNAAKYKVPFVDRTFDVKSGAFQTADPKDYFRDSLNPVENRNASPTAKHYISSLQKGVADHFLSWGYRGDEPTLTLIVGYCCGASTLITIAQKIYGDKVCQVSEFCDQFRDVNAVTAVMQEHEGLFPAEGIIRRVPYHRLVMMVQKDVDIGDKYGGRRVHKLFLPTIQHPDHGYLREMKKKENLNAFMNWVLTNYENVY